jgi:hypothetical protein
MGAALAKSTKIKRAGRAGRLDILAPTVEQMRDNMFKVEDATHVGDGASVTIGKAYRRTPMYLVLQSMFSDAEIKALKHYRHHADIADRSPLRDSLDKQIRGNGTGPTVEVVNAIRVRDDCERAAGSLKDILRAVMVYDWSLSQWAMQKGGALDVCREKEGKVVCRMEPRRKVLEVAQLEIKMAAKRVMAELDA